MKADLKRFGKIENDILTCGLHGWRYELATGRCLPAEGYRLYTQPITMESTITNGPDRSQDLAGGIGEYKPANDLGQLVRNRCKDCGYFPEKWPGSSKKSL